MCYNKVKMRKEGPCIATPEKRIKDVLVVQMLLYADTFTHYEVCSSSNPYGMHTANLYLI